MSKNAAITIQMLRDNPEWLNSKLGRELYRKCRPLVAGSQWEDALFPPRPDPEVEAIKKRIKLNYEEIQHGS